MNRPQSLSIRWTLWLAIALAVASSVLGTTGLMGYRMYRQQRLTDRIRVQALAEAYAAQVAGQLVPERRAGLESFLNGLAWHPDSRVLAVLSSSNTVQACRGSASLVDQYLAARSSGRPMWQIREVGDGRSQDCTVASAAILAPKTGEPLGNVVYAASTPAGNGMGSAENWGFFIYLIVIAATGMALGFFWLKRKVLDPLSALSLVGSQESGSSLSNGLSLDREDEIGELARTLASMHTDIEEWRNRATRLERSIDDRVAHATEQITRELKKAERKIWTDPLTRLGNRRLLDDKFEEIFLAQRNGGKELTIVMMDLDYFKNLNDTLGHRAGDSLLEFTGELLRQCLREQDLAIRYGGDEFVLILPSVPPEQALAIANRTIALFAQRSKLLPLAMRPTMSAGIASLRQHQPTSAEALLQMSDAALYVAKSAGKGRAVIYSSAMQGSQSAKAGA